MKPFSTYELSSLISQRTVKIRQYIRTLSDEIIMSGQDEVILHNLYEKNKFILIEIFEELIDRKQIKQVKIKKYNRYYRNGSSYGEPEYYQIDGVRVSRSFRFNGDSILFMSKSNTYRLNGYPDIEIKGNVLTLSSSEKMEVMMRPENKDLLDSRINSDLKTITEFASYCNSMAEEFNNIIKTIGESELNSRQEKIGSFYEISKMLEIPIDVKEPTIIETVEIKREIMPLMTKVSSEVNYTIPDEIYTGILGMIRHICSSFERTSVTFSIHDEEGLRDIILSQLNGVFQGKATGEAFRKSGKTDIALEFENRSAFVTECKIWKGIKSFEAALDQLFSYITWRDTKLCLIMFSKNKDFLGVIESIKSDFVNIEKFISYKEINKNEFEVKFKSDNSGQILTVRVFVFDLSVTTNVS